MVKQEVKKVTTVLSGIRADVTKSNNKIGEEEEKVQQRESILVF
jgi:hypothetical protein